MEALTAADPRAVGGYRLWGRLGAGGMGQVFLATSPAGRMVAVKVIHPELADDPVFIRRFRSEVNAAQRVSGMYTAPVVAAGADDTPPWLATAYVPGPSLDEVMPLCGPLPLPALWRLAAGLAEALHAIHAAGLVHRDLKPANVLLASDGPRVIDFGIARAVTDTRLTATGMVVGTPSFMSPEQVEEQPAGPASDIFSLGSVLAFAASGAPPFSGRPGGSSTSVMYRIAHGEADLARVTGSVRELIAACLAKDPGLRPDPRQVSAFCAAAADQTGLPPTTFWPPGVARIIAAQQAALSEQLQIPHANAALPAGAPAYAGTLVAVTSPGPQQAAPGAPAPPGPPGPLPQPGASHRRLFTREDATSIRLTSGGTGKKTPAAAASIAAAVPPADSGTVSADNVNGFDPTRPHAARIYDYLLGGKNHFTADRETAAQLTRDWPGVVTAAREQRAFLGRAVTYLAAEAGIRQFLDIGTGLPATNNVHEVAQAVDPGCRVVYVDNDPLVLAHARALLTSTAAGRTAYIHADLREPDQILSHPTSREVLDFDQPIALTLTGILHFIPDEDKPAEIIATLRDALPPGSYLVVTHITAEHDPQRVRASERTSRSGGIPAQFRDSADFARFAFAGLDLVPPGVVSLPEWRPAGSAVCPSAAEVSVYGGVARKPLQRPMGQGSRSPPHTPAGYAAGSEGHTRRI